MYKNTLLTFIGVCILLLIGQLADLRNVLAASQRSAKATTQNSSDRPLDVQIVGVSTEYVPVRIVSAAKASQQNEQPTYNPYRQLLEEVRTQRAELADSLEQARPSKQSASPSGKKEYRVFHVEKESRLDMSAISLASSIKTQLEMMSLDGYALVGVLPIVKDVESGGYAGDSELVGRTIGAILIGERDAR